MWKADINLIAGEEHSLFLQKAYILAQEKSQDPVTHTAGILVDANNTILSKGFNHLPPGLEYTMEQLLDKKWKYKHMIHAEAACVYDAAKKGKSTNETTMYMPWIPCTPCALTVIDSGISTFIGHKQLIEQTPERWWASTEYALELLRKADVDIYMFDGRIRKIEHLFNGNIWKP